MRLEHPATTGVACVDGRPLDGGATHLLITLFTGSDDAFAAATPELIRVLASLRTTVSCGRGVVASYRSSGTRPAMCSCQ